MSNPTVFMFSGQGSHYFQMGRSLYELNPAFKRWLDLMDEIARDLSGRSVIAVLYGESKKSDPFIDLASTHPAIFMVEYALAQALIERGVKPDFTLGTSMGSIAAAAVSGCLSVEHALSLVIGQASCLEACCEPGFMTTILAEPHIHKVPPLNSKSVISAINFSTHFVVSAPTSELGTVEESLRGQSVVFQRLAVSFAFHSPWIDAARDTCVSASAAFSGTKARVPTICCASAKTLNALPEDFFWNVIRAPIVFQHTIQALEATGSFNYLDVGPSATLATFLKYLLPSTSRSTFRGIMTPYACELDRFSEIVAGHAK
jgi:bacillaene synthase trans-acting acyltransferase